MSAHISKMVGKAEKEVERFISEMEGNLLYPSADVHLLDELNRSARQKIADLGLDPADTTGEELYHALRSKFERDSVQINRAIGISAGMSLQQRISRALQLVHHVHGNDKVWALKTLAAKNLLRLIPPKKTMARLNYRSLDSLLRREEPGRVLLCAQYLESASWQKSLVQGVSRLSPTDYEQRPVQFVNLINAPSSGPSDHIAVSKISGSLAVWPDKSLQNASGLHIVMLLLGGLNELGVPAGPKSVANTHPALNWWANTNNLISLHDDRPVSLNIHDVAANHMRGSDYSESSAHHGGKSLWAELEARYSAISNEMIPKVEADIKDNIHKFSMPTAAQLAEDMVSV